MSLDGRAESGLAAFSADVEDYFQVENLRPFCPRDRWDKFEDRTVANTERLLDLLARHEARGTFFILGWTARRHPDLVRRIAAAGHEVGSHGFDHELIYDLSREAFRRDIRRSRGLLQDLTGQPVLGYRAPSYTIVKRTLWALPILAEEGYLYDSSIFPIPRRRYGMPRAPRWPWRISLPEGVIAEFPLPTVDCGFVNLPATGGAYLRLLPFRMQRWALRRMMLRHQPFVLTVHPWELDPEQPRFPVGLRRGWAHYHNLARAGARLDNFLSMDTFYPLIDVLRTLDLVSA
jgi:polysaccharide deacetylase family protein (PEP-CTERM system associated)